MSAETNALIILPQKDFRDEEYDVTRKMLEESGIGIKVASLSTGECYGTGGLVAEADIDFSQVNTIDFDCVVFIGGPGAQVLFNEESVLLIAREFVSENKLTAAICWAPVILANAGILKGKNVTAWSGAKEALISAGANFTGDIVTIDGNLITADGPGSVEEFAQKIIDTLIG